ncbi:MAG: hypothetical protein R3194_02325, partial [Limnobacter sp.]|nr:hypothetical protein [Limnobacter sp.]
MLNFPKRAKGVCALALSLFLLNACMTDERVVQVSGEPVDSQSDGDPNQPPPFQPTETDRFSVSVARDGAGTGRVSSAPLGISCDGQTDEVCKKDYPEGTFVVLTAVADPKNRFTGWTGACAPEGTKASCALGELLADVSVGATFVPNPDNSIAVSLIGSAADTGSVVSEPSGIDCPNGQCAQIFPGQRQVTLTATPAQNTQFTGWYGAPECENTNPVCTLNPRRVADVKASFSNTPSVDMQSQMDAESCDITVSEYCLYPFPNNHFTVEAAKGPVNDTGLLVNLDANHMPRNVAN